MMLEPSTKTRRRRPKSIARLHVAPSVLKAGENLSKAVQRALDVLECFPDGQTNLSLIEISRLVGFNESTLFRILSTLEGRGYLQRNVDGSFKLTPKLLFGKLYERAEKIREVVNPFMVRLSQAFNEPTSLKFLFEDKIQVIDFVHAFQEIGQTVHIGKIIAPHCTSSGKVITAFQPRGLMDRILQSYGLHKRTQNTITDPQMLMKEFEQIRQQGFAVDREESHYGGCCFACPLFDQGPRVIGAISICSPLMRMNTQREADMIQALIDATRQASSAIQPAVLPKVTGTG
jgi:DNA-binding IclR family transcriptional regulator